MTIKDCFMEILTLEDKTEASVDWDRYWLEVFKGAGGFDESYWEGVFQVVRGFSQDSDTWRVSRLEQLTHRYAYELVRGGDLVGLYGFVQVLFANDVYFSWEDYVFLEQSGSNISQMEEDSSCSCDFSEESEFETDHRQWVGLDEMVERVFKEKYSHLIVEGVDRDEDSLSSILGEVTNYLDYFLFRKNLVEEKKLEEYHRLVTVAQDLCVFLFLKQEAAGQELTQDQSDLAIAIAQVFFHDNGLLGVELPLELGDGSLIINGQGRELVNLIVKQAFKEQAALQEGIAVAIFEELKGRLPNQIGYLIELYGWGCLEMQRYFSTGLAEVVSDVFDPDYLSYLDEEGDDPLNYGAYFFIDGFLDEALSPYLVNYFFGKGERDDRDRDIFVQEAQEFLRLNPDKNLNDFLNQYWACFWLAKAYEKLAWSFAKAIRTINGDFREVDYKESENLWQEGVGFSGGVVLSHQQRVARMIALLHRYKGNFYLTNVLDESMGSGERVLYEEDDIPEARFCWQWFQWLSQRFPEALGSEESDMGAVHMLTEMFLNKTKLFDKDGGVMDFDYSHLEIASAIPQQWREFRDKKEDKEIDLEGESGDEGVVDDEEFLDNLHVLVHLHNDAFLLHVLEWWLGWLKGDEGKCFESVFDEKSLEGFVSKYALSEELVSITPSGDSRKRSSYLWQIDPAAKAWLKEHKLGDIERLISSLRSCKLGFGTVWLDQGKILLEGQEKNEWKNLRMMLESSINLVSSCQLKQSVESWQEVLVSLNNVQANIKDLMVSGDDQEKIYLLSMSQLLRRTIKEGMVYFSSMNWLSEESLDVVNVVAEILDYYGEVDGSFRECFLSGKGDFSKSLIVVGLTAAIEARRRELMGLMVEDIDDPVLCGRLCYSYVDEQVNYSVSNQVVPWLMQNLQESPLEGWGMIGNSLEVEGHLWEWLVREVPEVANKAVFFLEGDKYDLEESVILVVRQTVGGSTFGAWTVSGDWMDRENLLLRIEQRKSLCRARINFNTRIGD